MSEWEGIGLQKLHWQDCSESLRTSFRAADSRAEAAKGALAGCLTASAKRHHALLTSSSTHQGVNQP